MDFNGSQIRRKIFTRPLSRIDCMPLSNLNFCLVDSSLVLRGQATETGLVVMAMTGDATIIGLFFLGIFTGKHRKTPYLMVDTMVSRRFSP
jgi:hypothetical protein